MKLVWAVAGFFGPFGLSFLPLLRAESVLIVNPSFEADPILGSNAPVFEISSTAPAGWA